MSLFYRNYLENSSQTNKNHTNNQKNNPLEELGEYLKKTYAKNLLNEAVEVRTTEGDVYEYTIDILR